MDMKQMMEMLMKEVRDNEWISYPYIISDEVNVPAVFTYIAEDMEDRFVIFGIEAEVGIHNGTVVRKEINIPGFMKLEFHNEERNVDEIDCDFSKYIHELESLLDGRITKESFRETFLKIVPREMIPLYKMICPEFVVKYLNY